MNYGVILAGGVGTRVKSAKCPKQFIEIEGKPIIAYTLENMLKVEEFDSIYVALHKDYLDYFKDMLNKHMDSEKISKIKICFGGKERLDSINNATSAIIEQNGLNDDDVIVIHDAARPFVTEKILRDSIEKAREYGAVVAALPASDTIIHSVDKEVVSEIPDRSIVFHGQAPDSFNLKNFLQMQENLTDEQRKIITGTSQICTFNNQPIHIIDGDAINFKITTDSDLLIATNIIKAKKEVKYENNDIYTK